MAARFRFHNMFLARSQSHRRGGIRGDAMVLHDRASPPVRVRITEYHASSCMFESESGICMFFYELIMLSALFGKSCREWMMIRYR